MNILLRLPDLSTINECALTNPCDNGGTCMDLSFLYNCTCASGWEGTNCQNGICPFNIFID